MRLSRIRPASSAPASRRLRPSSALRWERTRIALLASAAIFTPFVALALALNVLWLRIVIGFAGVVLMVLAAMALGFELRARDEEERDRLERLLLCPIEPLGCAFR